MDATTRSVIVPAGPPIAVGRDEGTVVQSVDPERAVPEHFKSCPEGCPRCGVIPLAELCSTRG